jgi:hypothetical protein
MLSLLQARSLAEKIKSIEKSSDFTGSGTHDLPVCNIAPQSSTLPRAPSYIILFQNNHP